MMNEDFKKLAENNTVCETVVKISDLNKICEGQIKFYTVKEDFVTYIKEDQKDTPADILLKNYEAPSYSFCKFSNNKLTHQQILEMVLGIKDISVHYLGKSVEGDKGDYLVLKYCV